MCPLKTSVNLRAKAATFFLPVFLVECALAQGPNSAGIQGQVVDASGGAIVGAAIAVTNSARGLSRQAVTDERGDYIIPDLGNSPSGSPLPTLGQPLGGVNNVDAGREFQFLLRLRF